LLQVISHGCTRRVRISFLDGFKNSGVMVLASFWSTLVEKYFQPLFAKEADDRI
jgi:hypothetical protein